MTHPSAIELALASVIALGPVHAQTPPLVTGRCARDLPLDAGQGFDHQRFLVLGDRTCLFDPALDKPGVRWRLASRWQEEEPAHASGLQRARRKWRDGALWRMDGNRILRRDPGRGAWVLMAAPAVEFMDFEVDMTGHILLVCTADPRTRTFRALLEAVEPGERGATRILAPYPDPGCMEWGRKVPPVAAATLQAGYESVQILEFPLLYNPLARRLFVFRPLEDRIKEVKLGLTPRAYRDLADPEPLTDLCWQVLPKDDTEAWLVRKVEELGLVAVPLDLFEGTAGEPVLLPGMDLPVFPGPTGNLMNLEEALSAFARKPTTPAGTPPPRPSPG